MKSIDTEEFMTGSALCSQAYSLEIGPNDNFVRSRWFEGKEKIQNDS